MSDDERDERDKLVVDVADALTLNQEVDWERCARQATAANRRALDNLRLIAGVFAGVRVAGDASTSAGPETRAGVVVRVAVRALLAVAAVEVAAALLLLPWAWEDMRRDLGDLAVFLAFLLVGCSLSACLLLIGGRHDRRTWLLGGYFLLQATSVQPSAMLTYIWDIPLSDLFGYPYTYPFLFAPAFLWAFARECPRVRRRTRLDGLARRMVAVSVVVGCALWVAYVAVLELARAGYLAETVFWWSFDVSLAVLAVLQLAAVVVVVLRARAAPAEEVRRVVLFGSGFLLSAGLVAVHEVVEAFTAGDWLSNYRWSPAAMVVALLRFPGVVLLWYSVLAVRVPHPREVVRTYGRRLLARGRLLALVAATPVLTLGWLAASRPERTVGAVLADPAVQSLAAAAGVMLLVVVARERLLLRLDTWLYPEIRDQREALAQVTGALARAGQIATVNRTVIRTVGRGCGAPGALLLAADTAAEAEDFSAPDAKTPPLARTGAIVHMLETAGGWLRVHPNDPTSLFGLLPPAEAAWVAAADADAIVPVPGPGAELLGVLVVGRRFDGRTVRPVDMPFLEAVGAAAGLAVARLRVAHGQQARPLEALPAQECPVCRCVTGPEEAPGCDCGFGYVEAEVPKVLAGKFELQRRLGAGGMGAAYLARDLRLERDVAVKTLTGVSVSRLMGLKPEAWAMATVTHPGVAQIHGIESWRGRPFLVVELLAGGTLEDRLRRGPVPASAAVSMTTRLAEALAALHETGYLHGDIKPSNVGFTVDGSPKLLDFGLAREANDEATIGGTVRYLSPEVLSGLPAEEADDVWSLCVVLHEMVSGEHPFAGVGVGEVTSRIRRQRPVRGVEAAAGSASAVLAFTTSMLTATRSARPSTARAFAAALRRAVERR